MSDATKPAPPAKPIVRQGDVLFSLGREIQEAARVVQEHLLVGERLKVYAELHPERHAHLMRFLAGDDQVDVGPPDELDTGERRERSIVRASGG